MTEPPPLWRTKVVTPQGVATDEETVRRALAMCKLEGVELQPLDPDNGIWMVGFPTSETADWTLESTGGGVVWPAVDEDGRLWLLDVPLR